MSLSWSTYYCWRGTHRDKAGYLGTLVRRALILFPKLWYDCCGWNEAVTAHPVPPVLCVLWVRKEWCWRATAEAQCLFSPAYGGQFVGSDTNLSLILVLHCNNMPAVPRILLCCCSVIIFCYLSRCNFMLVCFPAPPVLYIENIQLIHFSCNTKKQGEYLKSKWPCWRQLRSDVQRGKAPSQTVWNPLGRV